MLEHLGLIEQVLDMGMKDNFQLKILEILALFFHLFIS
jgi:hypothetical protein